MKSRRCLLHKATRIRSPGAQAKCEMDVLVPEHEPDAGLWSHFASHRTSVAGSTDAAGPANTPQASAMSDKAQAPSRARADFLSMAFSRQWVLFGQRGPEGNSAASADLHAGAAIRVDRQHHPATPLFRCPNCRRQCCRTLECGTDRQLPLRGLSEGCQTAGRCIRPRSLRGCRLRLFDSPHRSRAGDRPSPMSVRRRRPAPGRGSPGRGSTGD